MKKPRVGQVVQEGFTRQLGLEFHNGLKPYTQPLLWRSAAEVKEEKEKFFELARELKAEGVDELEQAVL